MLIQVATPFGWSVPQDVESTRAVQLLNNGNARAAVIEKIETTTLGRVKEVAAKIFGRKG